MPEQCLTRYKHKQIFIKQGLFCARCQRRDFLEQSSLGILTSPVPFPSITIIKPPKKAGHVLLKVVSFHPLRPPWLSLQHWWLGCSLRLREQAGSQQRSCQGSAPSQPIPACPSTSGTSHRAWEIKATPVRAQSAPHGSSGAGLDSPRERDGGFCPGSTKEKGWGGLGGSFVLLRGFLIDFSFFPSPGSSCWVPACLIPT